MFQSPLSGAVVRGFGTPSDCASVAFQSPLSGAVVRGEGDGADFGFWEEFQSPLSGAVVRGRDHQFWQEKELSVSVPSERGSGAREYYENIKTKDVTVSVPSERGSGAREQCSISLTNALLFQSPLSGAVVRGFKVASLFLVNVFQSPLSGAVVRGGRLCPRT